MKKISTLLLIIISTALSASDSMKARWELRYSYLEKMNETIPGNQADLKNLINGEIKNTKDFISYIERYNSGDSSLKFRNRKFSMQEIEDRVKEVASPAVATYYIKSVTGKYLSRTVTDSIAKKIKLHLSSSQIDSAISNSELIEMSREYILELGKERYERFLKNSLHEILAEVELRLSKNNYITNKIDLKNIIVSTATEKTGKDLYEIPESLNLPVLHSTSIWSSLTNGNNRHGELLTSIKLFASRRKISLPREVDSMKVDEIEKHIFRCRLETFRDMLKNTMKNPGKGGYNSMSYQIPDLSILKTLVSEIDKYRSNIVKNLKGSEGRLFSSRAENNIQKLTAKYINSIDKKFTYEKQRMNRLTSGKKVLIYNREMFNAAQKVFSGLKGKIQAYADDSASFIDSICLIGKKDPGEFIFTYKSRINKRLESLAFLCGLLDAGADSAGFGNRPLHINYTGAVQNTVKVSRFLKNPVIIPLEVRRGMTVESLRKVKNINHEFRNSYKSQILAIRKVYARYQKLHEGKEELIEKMDSESELRLGQKEMDLLLNFSEKCAGIYSKFRYSDNAFSEYRAKFTELENRVKQNSSDSNAINVIEKGTLINLCKDFNSKVIKSQHISKNMVRDMGLKSINGAVELYRYYTRKGIKLNIKPGTEEISRIKRELSRKSGEKILSWQMNEKNFKEINEKAVAYLKKMMNKNAWAAKSSSVKVSYEFAQPQTGMTLTIKLPMGWVKNSKLRKLPLDGMKRSFLSPDKRGEINVISTREENKNLKEFQENWNRKMGYNLVQKKWGTVSGKNYLWTVSKSRRNRVVQSYMVKHRGYILLISGTSDKNKSKIIHDHLDSILGSMKV